MTTTRKKTQKDEKRQGLIAVLFQFRLRIRVPDITDQKTLNKENIN